MNTALSCLSLHDALPIYPSPEILPEDAKAVRPDCIIGTGRSDYPNQVNNALCFPYLFRGALDVGASAINERSEEHTSELQSRGHLVCRLLLEKKRECKAR